MRLTSKSLASLLLLAFFSAGAASDASNWEEILRGIPQADRIRESNRVLSAEPHHLGSPYGEKNATWILERFREYGLEASIETFYVLFPTPKERVVELVEPSHFRARARRAAGRGGSDVRADEIASSRRTTPTRSTAT